MGERSRTVAMSSSRMRPATFSRRLPPSCPVSDAVSLVLPADSGRVLGAAAGIPPWYRREVRGRLVLWDIDYTLINAGGLSRNLYGVVFAELFGRELPAVAPMAGRTDRAIILDTLSGAGISEPQRYVDAFIRGLTARAPRFGERVRTGGQVLPGAAEALTAIAAIAAAGGAASPSAPSVDGRDGAGPGLVVQSVLTGNIRP